MTIRTIARLELRMARADGSLRWITAAIIVLLFFAAFNGWAWRQHRSATLDGVVAEATDRGNTWTGDLRLHLGGALDPRFEPPDDPYFVYAFFPHYAVALPQPLSVLSTGQSDLFASYAVGNMVEANLLYHDDEIQNPALLALGRLDLAFFLAVVLPILIIALTYDLIAQDRQSGRDRLVSLQAGSVARVVVLRAALRGTWVGVLVVMPLAAILVAAGAVRAGNLAATLLVLGLVLAYCLFWAALALAVNARGASPMRNAVLLLAIWGLTALFAPAAADRVATAAHPLPAGVLRPAHERALLQGISEAAAIERLARYETLSPGLSAEVDRHTNWVAGVELRRDTVAALAAQERSVIRSRQAVADRFTVLPPLLVYRALQRAAAVDTDAMLALEDRVAEARHERAVRTRSNPLRGEPASLAQVQHLAATMVLRHDAPGVPPAWLATRVAALVLLTFMITLVGVALMRRPPGDMP